MRKLTDSQLQFLSEQNITLNLMFDGEGFTKTEYQERMKSLGKLFVYNTSPCKNSGHSLRSRSGHCIQCNTAYIGFTKRSSKAGFVYIAQTKNGKLIKIGFSENMREREKSLIRTKYGEFDDWKILFGISCINAGKLEIEIKKEMNKYAQVKTYNHDGKKQVADELYRCKYSIAKEKLKELSSNPIFNSENVEM
ncbi:GIY-YIG nuclease family protein [Flavobacterium wongokense]|uniref:GIY-YIG nuclease family protein n=1 Tax=Flavobacterium wongokense TaxID=2910674 RepID=UPI001F1A6AEA|nr:GIY-YIG nuclease family protein [Flavobacterium sp. WG47]MCF6133458.1 GIY-YIG nuclease family protein [Flavobacterium sp. WG47]